MNEQPEARKGAEVARPVVHKGRPVVRRPDVDRPLGAGQMEPWVADSSRLEEVVGEAAALAMIAYTCDTTDPAKEAAHLRYSGEILPRLEELEVKLARRLLDSGYSTPELGVTLRRFQTAASSSARRTSRSRPRSRNSRPGTRKSPAG